MSVLRLIIRVERGRVKGYVRACRGREGTGRGLGISCKPPVSVRKNWGSLYSFTALVV